MVQQDSLSVKEKLKEGLYRKRLLTGTVISDKMNKTIVVSVERTFQDDRVGKVVRSSKNYKVHDEHGKARAGDIVQIYEGRPKSKTKYMYLGEVVQVAG